MMLGMGLLGYTVTYLIGIAMLALTLLLGKIWNKRLPPTLVREEGWNNRVVARIAILAAVAAVGGLIMVPGPATSIRFDSLAGYFGALMYGWQVGAIVAMFGTFFSNLMSGFSSSAAMLPYYLMNMALAAVSFGLTYKLLKRSGFVASVVVGTLVNTLCILPWILMLGWGMMVPTLIPQVVASFFNVLLAAVAYKAITSAQKRRRVEPPDQAEASLPDDAPKE